MLQHLVSPASEAAQPPVSEMQVWGFGPGLDGGPILVTWLSSALSIVKFCSHAKQAASKSAAAGCELRSKLMF